MHVVCPTAIEAHKYYDQQRWTLVCRNKFLGEIYSICPVQILNWGRGKPQNCCINTLQFPSKWTVLQCGYSVSFWYGFPQMWYISFILNCCNFFGAAAKLVKRRQLLTAVVVYCRQPSLVEETHILARESSSIALREGGGGSPAGEQGRRTTSCREELTVSGNAAIGLSSVRSCTVKPEYKRTLHRS